MYDIRSFLSATYVVARKASKIFRSERGLYPCDAGAVLHRLSFQAIRSCNFACRHWRNVQRVVVDI